MPASGYNTQTQSISGNAEQGALPDGVVGTFTTLTASGNLTVAGNATITGSVTAGSIIGTINETAGYVATADDGTSQTLTAGMVTGGPVLTFHTSTGGTTPSLTMPLATGIIAGNSGWVTGDAYVLRVINANSGIATLVTNTGITTSGTLTIPPGGQADYVIRMASATTVTMTRVSTEQITLAGAQALTNKTYNGLTVTSSTGTLTVPAGVTFTGPGSTGTAATLANAETLTNKTLTAPITTGLRVNPATGLTAVGTDRATSLALTADVNNVTTAGASTGVTLPAATVGATVIVYNNGANLIQVYGAGSDTIDGAAAATGVALTNAKRCAYRCVAAATWLSDQLGVVSA